MQKQQTSDRLQEELQRVKAKLRHQERTASEGPFGAATRGTLMSALLTLQKRTADPLPALTAALDALVADPNANVYRLFFAPDTS